MFLIVNFNPPGGCAEIHKSSTKTVTGSFQIEFFPAWHHSWDMLETSNQTCPYCNEPIELVIDCSVASQKYTEDCQVCCRPMIVTAEISYPDEIYVMVMTEDEYI